MTSSKLILLLGVAITAPAGAALAQSQPSAPAPTPPVQAQTPAPAAPQTPAPQTEPGQAATVGDVVVTGRTTDIRSSIDSQSYSVADDLQSATGTLADSLRGVPSVEVDPDGNVSLRGDANVTILVDGRPSAVFGGESRGQAVLNLPSSQYSRIEVMTNPSAAYRPDGSGGVINLITKPTTVKPGATTTGSVRANVGDDGRYNAGGNIAYTRDKLTLTGDAGVRHDTYVIETERERDLYDTASARFLPAHQTQVADGASDSISLRGVAEYRLDPKTQLTGEVRFTDVDSTADALDLYTAENAAGGTASAYRRSTYGGFSGQFYGVTGRVLRRFDDQGHEWTNELRLDRADTTYSHDTTVSGLIPAAADFFERVGFDNDTDTVGFSSTYVRPMPHDAKLRAGYELDYTSLDSDNLVLRGPAPTALTPDPTVSNAFNVDQTVHALYATYERPFGKLTAQFGLRLEQTLIDLDQVTSGTSVSNDYFKAYPTLHLSYQLTPEQTLRGSFSRRIQRPSPNDLNPFLSYQDPLSYRAGNPDLEPQETDSFEVTWQRRVEQTFYQATVYYRDTNKAFSPVVSDLGDGILLTRPENLGSRTALGVELVASGKLHPTLRYNASANVFRQEIETAGLVGASDSAGTTVSGRLNLSWQPTTADFVQVSTVWTGDQLLAQGERDSQTLVNLGYRRKLNASWSFQATVRDLFDNFGDTTTFETASLRDRTERVFGGRTAFIGLTWNFGQGQRRPEQFDFSAAPTGG
jgi:outer membrane receptor protein involved in Fe transport